MKGLIKRVLGVAGYDVVPRDVMPKGESAPDLTADERETVARVAPFTMTSAERIISLIQATRHVVENGIAGDIAECGVWRGGSMMAIAETLKRLGDTSRRLYLYDTFEGMSIPAAHDVQFDGRPAGELFDEKAKENEPWCYAGEDEVRRNLESTGYPSEMITLVKGKVEATIPGTMPEGLALLRLDTDWYESTRHELVHLYPKLANGGILIIDDYGHWQGAKQAVDEYFATNDGRRPFLHRVDYTARLIVKP